ncbi:hypothetical protein [Thermogymnomonas acidicola]|uniref:hypothetical protein n=1 Tax=Thermogymnomonas acidicola TaxID=399579 RepID=UPI0009465A3E|nr:hypothetical protein [Thermogymnomonas acidicola]
MQDPRVPLKEVSRLTGLSGKTVGKHKARMLSSNQLCTIFIPDFTRSQGGIFYALLVYPGDLRATSTLQGMGLQASGTWSIPPLLRVHGVCGQPG